MTPARAIKIECDFCNGFGRPRRPCESKHCAIADRAIKKSLQRIKKYCQDCSTDHRVDDCTGYLIGTQAKWLAAITKQPLTEDGKAQCPLYPFRYGKNPNRNRTVSEDQKKAFAERTRAYRFQKKETFSASARVEHRAGVRIWEI